MRHGNVVDLDRVALCDDVNVSALRAALNRRKRNQTQIALGVHQQVGIHKLLWKENVVFVVEDRFELVGSGGGIDLIVDGEKFASGDFGGVVAVPGFGNELRTAMNFFEDLLELVLRQRENHRDRLHLRD